MEMERSDGIMDAIQKAARVEKQAPRAESVTVPMAARHATAEVTGSSPYWMGPRV